MNKTIYNLVEQRLASINNVKDVKDVNKVKKINDVKDEKEVKEEKEDKQLQLARLRALNANSTELTSSSSFEVSKETQELLDSRSREKWLCDGPAENHWARFRAQLFLQTTNRGDEWKLKLLMTTETNTQVELMATLGRKWDFLRGINNTDDAWYQSMIDELDTMATGDRCGKFYLANTRINAKKNRNTQTQAYTSVILKQVDQGVYIADIWLWRGYWRLYLTDTYLTDAQKKKNMLANTQWFNAQSKVNHTDKTALDVIGWRKK